MITQKDLEQEEAHF